MRTSLCALAACWLTLSPTCAAAQSGPTSGRILVLKNDRTLEGDIVCDGIQYVIRRSVGEITLSVDRAQKLCANWEDAFAFVRSQANLRDPDERLRLARWCQQHGLKAQAITEAAAAVQLRPGHGESQRLLKHLQRVEQPAVPAATTESPKVEMAPLPAVDLNSEALSLFTTRVQPILMNACANCHCNGRGGSFQLLRVSSSSATNRGATQHNLAAVLRRVDLERPGMSILLIKALSDHAGTGQAPIKKRESTVYRNLEDWLQATIASNPHLRELPELRRPGVNVTARVSPPTPAFVGAPTEKPAFATAEMKQPAVVTERGKEIQVPPTVIPTAPVGARPVPTVASTTPPQPARPLGNGVQSASTEPDEYDPTDFNRRTQSPQGPPKQ